MRPRTFFRRRRKWSPSTYPPPCLELDTCALTLGYQWCTCYAPVHDEKRTHARKEESPPCRTST